MSGGADYLSVVAPEGAEVATQVVDLTTANLVNIGRVLVEGEEVLVTWGDRSGGGGRVLGVRRLSSRVGIFGSRLMRMDREISCRYRSVRSFR